jgi:DNA-binding GntR family transcriptional regulator
MPTINGARIRRELLGDKVADVVRRMILTGELSAGTRLVEDDLAARLGTSRGPLRDALSRLGRECLVENRPGRGTYVKGLTAESIQDLFALRTILESFAAELAAVKIEPEEAEELRGLLDQMDDIARNGDGGDYADVDMEIHRQIWRIAGNEYLVEVLESLVLPVTVFVKVNAEYHHDWSEVVWLHRQLIEAIASGDKELAARTMHEHQANAVGKALAAHSAQARADGSRAAGDAPR